MINADNTVGNGSRRDRRRDKDASGGVPAADYPLIAVRSVVAFPPFSFSRPLAVSWRRVQSYGPRPSVPGRWSLALALAVAAANNSRPTTSCDAR
uniref:Uncharacterized protein n=1 Tax=Plectus sambesii TaxID=2011161 RepID=A0A914WET8_9BILA